MIISVSIIAYLSVAFVALCICKAADYCSDDSMQWFVALLWPLSIVITILLFIAHYVNEVADDIGIWIYRKFKRNHE